ncbi:MAG: ABC transporter ATP-binding protein [Lachnospiraceae bacterium]|jgi:ABC-type nitrate/sulfonate/bicarbonate transport system ATPase subunit|nr:ABC transporter ATP-binding protein [Lachnospiraceae bacterium]
MSGMIQCEHIVKKFPGVNGDYEVIKDISIEAKKNEILVLFGSGQCGKTTLLKVIAGLEPVTSGKIFINGKEKTAPGPECGLVYQTTVLFPWLTTMGNVEYGPKMRGMSKKERREKAQHYIDLVGLRGFEKSFPNQLSGGMRQRVGIARVYCNEPDVLLMDEPFGHLDAQTRYLMQEELERIWQTEKRTIVFVTNNIEEALYLADRVLVMSNCPAVIKKEFKVDLPRPRDYTSPEFLRLRQEITSIVDPAEL